MRGPAVALAVLLLLGCARRPPEPAAIPRVPVDGTIVDRLVLVGEVKGVTPGTDILRVRAAFPDATGVEAGVESAGLLVVPGGLALITDRSGGRIAALWLEFAGSKRVPATTARSADGRLGTGATEETVRAWLRDHGVPILMREIVPPVGPAPGSTPVVREYYVDRPRTWLVVVDGRLAKAIAGDRHLFEEGRREAKVVED